MSERYALIVDADDAFRARLEAILTPGGFETLVAGEEAEALDLFTRHKPEAVFIAVDLPDKEGFVLFSKIKKLRRVVPVFLVTSSVSRADLKLHEKLKVHADAYWDKRDITDEAIVERLEAKVGLERSEVALETTELPANSDSGIAESEPEGESDVKGKHEREGAVQTTAPRYETAPWLSEVLDPETVSLLAEIGEEGLEAYLPPRTPASADGAPSPEQLAELEDELARARKELEQARQDARSSPFSSEFATLRESASKNDKAIRTLKTNLKRRESQIALVTAKLTELARRVRDGDKHAEASAEKQAELLSALESLRGRFERLQRDADEQAKQFEQDRSVLKEMVASGQEALRGAQQRHEATLRTLEQSYEDARRVEASQNAERERELDARHEQERAKLAADLKAKYDARIQELQDVQAGSLTKLRDQHRQELESLHRQQREAAEKSAAEAQKTLKQQSEQSADLLRRANEQRTAELERAESKRKEELEEAAKRHQGEVEELEHKHQAVVDRLQQELATTRSAAENVHAEFTAKLADLVTSLDEERNRHQETRERYEREIAEAQSTHAKSLEQAEHDQFSALASMSRKFREDRSRLVESERKRAEERVEKLQKEHKAAIDALVARHAEESMLLKTAHDSEIEQLKSDMEQEVRRRVENARSELEERLDQADRQHADDLAALRHEHENETARLRATHMEALAERDREARAAVREAVERANADSLQRIEDSKREAERAQSALKREYEDEIATLEQAHRDAVAKRERESARTLQSVAAERDEARASLATLRTELAELQSRHRAELEAAEAEHDAERQKLKKETRQKLTRAEEEKEFLASSVEKLKRQSQSELQKTLDSLANEKKLHQATRDRYERRIAELKASHNDTVKSLENDWMQTLQGLEQSLVGKTDDQAAKVESEWRKKLDAAQAKHEEAVKALTNDFTMEIATLRQQVERTRVLEEAYQAGAQEITALKAKVESLTEELTSVHMQLAERQADLDVAQKRLAETAGSIDSLKAVIEDFSRSVKGFDQERQESDETIDSLKAVIDDFYRSLDQKN